MVKWDYVVLCRLKEREISGHGDFREMIEVDYVFVCKLGKRIERENLKKREREAVSITM